MVICCVPQCGTDSWRCDPSISFHDFPAKPDLAAKWIHQINSAVTPATEPMWFPRGKPHICSKHFLSTDFRENTDTLKNKVLPTVFGHRYIGQEPEVQMLGQRKTNEKAGPLIVKIKTEDGGHENLYMSDVYTQSKQIEAIINEPENISPSDAQSFTHSKGKHQSNSHSLHPNGNQQINSNSLHSNEIHQSNSNSLHPKENHQINSNSLHPKENHQSNSLHPKESHQKNSNSLRPKENQQANPNLTKPKNIPNKKTATAKNKVAQKTVTSNKNVQSRESNDNLIEIGPNTFLKINPDIIKINKKLTPSGNTVLQFLMDQNLANTIGADMLPKIVQGAISNINNATANMLKNKSDVSNANSENTQNDTVVQHVLGHLVDTHVCKESCAQLQDDILMETDQIEQESDLNACVSNNLNSNSTNDQNCDRQLQNDQEPMMVDEASINSDLISKEKTDSSRIVKAPVLLTTNTSLAHCFMEKTKYLSNLRQKSRQIASLKKKVALLNKKIEDLEDKCIVQERQLSLSFLKRIWTIRKDATNGDPSATYILEQIRAYAGQKQMRWSDTTLQQCAIWCRKAPYAYEYFKKADFFKLPCLGTVKRYMKKHPQMNYNYKANSRDKGNNESDSSSDFDFDEEDSTGEGDKEKDNVESIECETIISEEASNSGQQSCEANSRGNRNDNAVEVVFQDDVQQAEHDIAIQNLKFKTNEEGHVTVDSVDGTKLEVQELILPSGEVVQCYSSNLSGGAEGGNQYYIIPNAGDQDSNIDHEYSIIQSADSMPVILRNIDQSQEQLIFITNSEEQAECTETEVVTTR